MKQQNNKLSERMIIFLDHQSVSLKSSTVNLYRTKLTHFNNFLKEIYQTNTIHEKHLVNLSKSHLQKYLLYLGRQDIAPSTKQGYFIATRKYLDWEAEQGTVSKDAIISMDHKQLPKIPEQLPRPLSRETDLCLQNRWRTSNNPYSKIFLLLRLTGMRIGELINLSLDCVITNHKNETYLKIPLGKLNNERIIPISYEVVSLINEIKSKRQFYAGIINEVDQHRLIGISGSTAGAYTRLSKYFRKDIAGHTDQNKPITFHRLRHTYATTLLTGGVSIVSIMKLLGHRKIQMSLRYAMVTPSHLRDEYLSAIKNLETKCAVKLIGLSEGTSCQVSPANLISKLRAFADKAAKLDHHKKKILLRRLSRLQYDLESISFSQDFKLDMGG